MAAALDIVSPVGIVAGAGAMPFAVADQLAARGLGAVILALKGACDPIAVTRYRHHWVSIGQIRKMTKLLRSEGCRDLIFIGGVARPSLSEVRLDLGSLRLVPLVAAALRGGDDHLLSGVGRIFEQDGFRMIGVKDAAPDLLMPQGCVTRTVPDGTAEADIARGRDLLAAISPFDIGQAVVVIEGHVVAVEDIEGTDGLLSRVARLREEGRIRAKAGHGVLVKAPKRGQDLRYDLPAVGPRTVEGAARAGLGGIAVAAGNAVAVDPQAMIEAADKAGLFVTGIDS